MKIEEMRILLRLCDIIGVETLGDLQLFAHYQCTAGKSLIDCVIDYVGELLEVRN